MTEKMIQFIYAMSFKMQTRLVDLKFEKRYEAIKIYSDYRD